MSKKIFVKNNDLGFWTQTLVPVQKYDGEEMIYCNHDGAKEEENVQDFWNPITSDHTTRTDWVLVCKCGAYRFESDDEWNNAPVEGRHNG